MSETPTVPVVSKIEDLTDETLAAIQQARNNERLDEFKKAHAALCAEWGVSVRGIAIARQVGNSAVGDGAIAFEIIGPKPPKNGAAK